MDSNPLAGGPDRGLVVLGRAPHPLLPSPPCISLQLSVSTHRLSPVPFFFLSQPISCSSCVCVCVPHGLWTLSSLTTDRKPWHWKHRVLTTGPPFPLSPVLSSPISSAVSMRILDWDIHNDFIFLYPCSTCNLPHSLVFDCIGVYGVLIWFLPSRNLLTSLCAEQCLT